MKRVLLISNRVFHYRIRVYNAFVERFQKMGYEFHVISNEYQKVDYPIKFIKHERPFSVRGYIDAIKEIKPDVCINFLHLKDMLIVPLTLYCRAKGIPMIYWNHGINLNTPNNKLKNSIFHFIHFISSAIILYSPAQLKFLTKHSRKKTFIAMNTLDFSDVDKSKLRTSDEVKHVYGIKEKKILLYISRILPHKGLDILLKLFRDTPDIGLVIVGGGINDEQMKIVNDTPNYYYLGEKYGSDVDEIYQIGDVFSTPGHIGLALNQAMYWGLPVVVLNRIHAPEIIYLHDGVNGRIIDTEEELKQVIVSLCTDEKMLDSYSKAARETYEKEMSIDIMFKGFNEAIDFVSRR